MAHEELEMTLDHVTLSVEDLDRADDFYGKLLSSIGFEKVADFSDDDAGESYIGFGIGRKGSLWIVDAGLQTPGFHLCFRSKSRQDVRDFHAAGLAAGDEDNGRPAIREIYHPAYYAAFVLDPEGHNIEAVCFEAET